MNYALLWSTAVDWNPFSPRRNNNRRVVIVACLIHRVIFLSVENRRIHATNMSGVFVKALVAASWFENAACKGSFYDVGLMKVGLFAMSRKESSYWHTVHTLFVLFDSLLELSLRERRFVGVDSDVWHVGNQGVFFNHWADGISEILYLFLFGCRYECAHACLALKQRLVRLLHRGVVFIWEENAELAEVYLTNGSHALRVTCRVKFAKEFWGLDGVVNVYH